MSAVFPFKLDFDLIQITVFFHPICHNFELMYRLSERREEKIIERNIPFNSTIDRRLGEFSSAAIGYAWVDLDQ